MSKTLKRILVATVVAVCLCGIALDVAIEHVLPYSIIRPHRITHDELVKAVHGDVSPEFFGLHSEPFNITVEDTIRLKGWFIHADSSRPLGTVVVLHGIASCKEAMLPRARSFAHAGFNSIVFDLRAHGESGGQYCTFGYREKEDVRRYIDSALARFGPAVGPVVVWGGSLGAAVALQVMESDSRIQCGVVESPFATLREVVFDYMKRMSGISVQWIADAALTRAGEIARFPVDSIRPQESARHVMQPVMVVHGLQDEHISSEYGKRIYQNLCSTDKVWVPVAQATHFTISSVGGEAYKRQMTDFFLNHVR
jgi:uncharacterized protein